MLSLTLDSGIPKKVLAKAHQLGVHNDCIVSGKPCTECAELIFLAFDFFYSHCETTAEVIGAIIDDFKNDLEEER